MTIGVVLAVIWGAVFLVMPAHAFFADNNNHKSTGGASSTMNGDATGEAEGTFGMTFEGNGSTSGALNGNTVGRANADGNLIDDHRTNGQSRGNGSVTGFGDGRGDAKGGAKFSMTFSGRAKGKGNFDADGEGSVDNVFAGENRDYYYRPYDYPNTSK